MSARELESTFRARPVLLTGGARRPDDLGARCLRDHARSRASEIAVALATDGEITLRVTGARDLDERAAEWRESLARPEAALIARNEALHVLRVASERFEVSWTESSVEATLLPSAFPEPATGHVMLGVLRDLATAHAGLRVSVEDRSAELRATLVYPRGALDRLHEEAASRSPGHLPVRFRGEEEGVSFDVAFGWRQGPGLQVVAIVNGERTPNGGTHVLGVWEGIARAIDARIPRTSERRALSEGELPRNAVLVTSVHLDEPRYGPAMVASAR